MIGKIRSLRTRWQVGQAYKTIAGLNQAELLNFMLNPDSGLEMEDYDSLVQLAFESHQDDQREAIIQRISEHFVRIQKEKRRS